MEFTDNKWNLYSPTRVSVKIKRSRLVMEDSKGNEGYEFQDFEDYWLPGRRKWKNIQTGKIEIMVLSSCLKVISMYSVM